MSHGRLGPQPPVHPPAADPLAGGVSLSRHAYLALTVELSTGPGAVTKVRLTEQPNGASLVVLPNRLHDLARELTRIAHRLGVRP
jgi:hypothetical protein